MRAVLTLIAAVLFALGWVAGVVALGVLWCWSGLAVGWDAATRPRPAADDRVGAS